MRNIYAGLILFSTLIFAARAQDATNAPKTDLEFFEAQPDTLIVKGLGQPASVTTSAGTISVRCKESMDVASGHKQYGIVVELGDNNQPQERLIVDYSELDSLLNSIDYLSKISYDVTPLPAFEAVYVTKSGLRLEAHSSRRLGGIQTFLQYADNPRIPLASDQVAQLRDLIGQARTALTDLMNTK
jgi:hypothetical protein